MSLREGIAMLKPDDLRDELRPIQPHDRPFIFFSKQAQELRKRKFEEEVRESMKRKAGLVPELWRSHFIVKAPHYLPSKWAYVDDSSMKVKKNYGYDCDKKPAGNQGECSAAEKSEGKAESAGPDAKSIPQSQEDGSSPPARVSHTSTQMEVPPDNEQEKHARFRVIPPGATGVTLHDIGGMDGTKEVLGVYVIRPYQRPGVVEPCKGILLYGPSGTGKTTFARAIATEAGATFIDCSLSNLVSLVPEEVEKNVRDLFTFAARVAPAIIFVENVDSMLAKRAYGEPVFMRILKDEFMSHWDGLMTKAGEQIIVLGTTNRPYDLDEAAIRRFELRVLFDLSSEEDRKKILTIFLSKVKNEGIDFKELASMTEGYTGSDLEILCKRAANLPRLELIQRREELLRAYGFQTLEEQTITVRPLTMDDMMEAKNLVGTSVAVEGVSMAELKEWYELYGKGGSGKKDQPLMFELIKKRLPYLT